MFTGLQLTTKGTELLSSLLAGHNVEFTSIKMGDGNRPSDISALTDLVSVKQTLPIARYSVVDAKTMVIGSNLLGKDVAAGFYWKEVGIFAKDLDGDGKEYLFSYDNAGDNASFIPTGGVVVEQLIDLSVVVGNVNNVTINISESLVFATVESLNNAINNLSNSLTTKINTDVQSVNTALTNHINNKENPHAVTKSQVGLGSVENYGMATEAEAKAGTSNSKYMTPLRAKNLLQALGVQSDGNVKIVVSGTQPSAVSGTTIIWINTNS